MSQARVTIAYDGPALEGGVMDVRDLAPALLAAGQLVDAANSILYGDSARASVQVTATGTGSFEVVLQVVQSIGAQITSLLTSEPLAAASTLATLIFGTPAAKGVLWLIKRCRGRRPDRVERISDAVVKLTIDGESIEIPMNLLRLFQDLPVRIAAQRLIEQPLQKDGIDAFEIRENKRPVLTVTKQEAVYFARPEIPDETIVDVSRRAAYSIVSLAFKEDNRWRLNDGNNVISVSISDQDFLARVDNNQIAFAKNDILICEVRVIQKQTEAGLKTDYIVEKVVEHRTAARQLPLGLESPSSVADPAAARQSAAGGQSGVPANPPPPKP